MSTDRKSMDETMYNVSLNSDSASENDNDVTIGNTEIPESLSNFADPSKRVSSTIYYFINCVNHVVNQGTRNYDT